MNRTDPPGAASSNSLRIPVLVLALLTALFLLPTFSLDSHALRFGPDIVHQFYPSKFFLRESLLAGHLPFWNPYTFGGTPFLANPQRAALFYPDALLWFVLPLKIGIWLTQAVHLLLAALGMFLLVRHYTRSRSAALFAAVSFAFGSYFACRVFAGHLPQMESSVWLPWIVLAVEKTLERDRFTRWSFVAATLLALSLLAGFPEIAFMSGLTLALRFVWELASTLRVRDTARARIIALHFAVVIGVTVGLVAVQVVPALELIARSDRVDTSYDVVRARSLPVMNLATLVIPDLLGNAALRNTIQGSLSFESASYVGLAPLLFALAAPFLRRDRRVFFAAALAGLGVFLALGGSNPLYPLVRVLPGFKQVAAPYRFVFLVTFAIPVLAGFGAQALGAATTDDRRARRFVGFVLAAAGIAVAVAVLFWAFRDPILALARRAILARYPDAALRLTKLDGFYATQLAGLIYCAVFSVLLGLLLIVRARGRAVFPLLLITLVALDLGVLNGKYVRAIGTMESERPLGYEAFTARDPEPHRVLPLPEVNPFPEAVLLHGVSSIVGYDPIVLKTTMHYLEALEAAPPGEEIDPRTPRLRNYKSPLADRLNVKYVISEKPLADPALVLDYEAGKIRVYRKKAFFPRAHVAHRIERLPDDAAVLARLAKTPADTSVALVTPDVPEIAALASAKTEPVPRVTLGEPNRRTIRADLAAPGLLVVSETYLPGWRATVDGHEAPVVRADYLFCGVALPAGHHTVVLEYAPASARVGAAISGATLLGVGLFSLLRRRRPSPRG